MPRPLHTPDPAVLCVGAVVLDTIARSADPLAIGDDVPGTATTRAGGVAANIARAIALRGGQVSLLSALGRDQNGQRVRDELSAAGVDCTRVVQLAGGTDQVVTLENPDGERFAAVADCRQWDAASRTHLDDLAGVIQPWNGPIVIDGNADAESLASLLAAAARRATLVPASDAKAVKLRNLIPVYRPRMIVNKGEVESLLQRPFGTSESAADALLEHGAWEVAVTDGPRNAVLANQTEQVSLTPPSMAIVSTLGAGDAFAAGLLTSVGVDLQTRLSQALSAAAQHLVAAGEQG
ncbi:MAG: PfkB family carbohydrate kinase [Pseudomonadota bacterium]